MAQGNAQVPRMYHADTGNTGPGPIPIGGTVPNGAMGGKWHPTVLALLGLLAVEVAAFAALRYTFAKL